MRARVEGLVVGERKLQTNGGGTCDTDYLTDYLSYHSRNF